MMCPNCSSERFVDKYLIINHNVQWINPENNTIESFNIKPYVCQECKWIFIAFTEDVYYNK